MYGKMLCIAFALTLFVPRNVTAQPTRTATTAAEHFALGARHFDRGQFGDAAREFQAAYDLSHNSVLLFNLARAHTNLNNFQQAIDAYQRYRDAGCPQRQCAEITTAIQELETRRGPILPTTVVPTPTVVTPPGVIPMPLVVETNPRNIQPPVLTQVSHPPRLSPLNRYGPFVTMGIGGVLAGLGFWQALAANADRAIVMESASGFTAYTQNVAEAHGRIDGESVRGALLLASGSLTIAGGLFWLAVRRPTLIEHPPHIQPVIGLNTLGVGGTF